MDQFRAKHILVAEDSAVRAGMLAAALTRAGFVPLGPFATLSGATEAVNRQRVDAAIVGIRLQGSPTFPLVRLIVALDIPVLVVVEQVPTIIPAGLLGARFCQAPLAPAELLHLLAATIDAASMSKAGAASGAGRGAPPRSVLALWRAHPLRREDWGGGVTPVAFAARTEPPA